MVEHSSAAAVDPRGTVRMVVRLAAPAIAQQLLYTLVFLVDRAMLGHHGAASLASMQIAGPLVWTTVSLLSASTVGTVALVGRAVGAGDRALATGAVRGSLWFSAAVGVAVSVAGLLALPVVPLLFPAAGAPVLAAADGYLTVFLPSVPLFLVSFSAAAALTAAGDTKTPFVIGAVGNAINVALNYVLIFGLHGAPELGAAGAAVGSAAAMGWNAAAGVVVLSRRRGRVSFRGPGDAPAALRRMVRVSLPSAAERAVQQLGFLGFVMMIGALGEAVMAANQALISIESICFLSAEGFGIAAAAVVAQRLGAGRRLDAGVAAKAGTALAVAFLSLFAVLFVVVPDPLLRAFTDDAAIVATGRPVMVIAALSQPFLAVSMVLSQALRGAGETRAPFVIMVIGGLFVRLAATWLFAFPLGFGLTGVWVGSTLDWIVRAALLGWVFLRGGWRDAAV